MNLEHQLHNTAMESYSNRSDSNTKRSGNGFHDLGIAPSFMKEIKRLSFTNPTPIQKDSIPVGIQGKDVIAVARTGSGKTLAFGIPMLQRLSQSKKGTGLILIPTRELALQVQDSLQAFARLKDIDTAVLIGGASITPQFKALQKNPRVIIATPGRLMDHLERKTANLSHVEVFVLDEADRMLDMGFVRDIKQIMKSIPDNRQTMLFSATMPKEIEAIAAQLMEDPVRIEADRSGTTPAEVSHEMFFIKNQDKSRLLAVQLQQCAGPVLVFTRTKRMASKLTMKVKNMGFAAAEIHSDRSQGQRQHALNGFKRGKYQILIATDIAARGIDVTGIELVVNYDMPANSEDYVHRIGRTGRAGKMGHAVSFTTNEQRGAIKHLERFMKTKLAISALPTLPSEKFLQKEADRLKEIKEASKEDKQSRRKASKSRQEKRKDSRKDDFKRTAKKRVEPKLSGRKRKESQRQKSKRKGSAQSQGLTLDEMKFDDSFWSNFKNKKSSKKKSAGQGSKRKKRSKRK